MELTDLLDEYNIEYITKGQDSSRGFVNIHCTVGCIENSTFKRGIKKDMSYSTCWVCGEHLSGFQTAKHLGIPWTVWKAVMELQSTDEKEFNIVLPDTSITVPGTPFLDKVHVDYLHGRGLDANFMRTHWDIHGT